MYLQEMDTTYAVQRKYLQIAIPHVVNSRGFEFAITCNLESIHLLIAMNNRLESIYIEHSSIIIMPMLHND
jgi:hypothetical protein